MVTGQLLWLSSAMSGGVLDISHHLFSVGLLGFVDFFVNLLN
jgi:hypothetical protein